MLDEDGNGGFAWYLGAVNDHIKALEILCHWGREVQVNVKDDLLLAKRFEGLKAWDIAAGKGKKEVLETLWGWGREVQVNVKDELCWPNVG